MTEETTVQTPEQDSAAEHTKRILNLGHEVEIKEFPEGLVVKELGLKDLVKIVGRYIEVFGSANVMVDPTNPTAIYSAILTNDACIPFLEEIAAASTGKPLQEFQSANEGKGLTLVSWLKLANKFKKVIDWEEIVELFFELTGQPRNQR